jgi:hypothetical protein
MQNSRVQSQLMVLQESTKGEAAAGKSLTEELPKLRAAHVDEKKKSEADMKKSREEASKLPEEVQKL